MGKNETINIQGVVRWTTGFILLLVLMIAVLNSCNKNNDGNNPTNPFVLIEPTPTPTPVPCAGVRVNDYCWYLGDLGQSCSQGCSTHGGYNEATCTYAGSDGTNKNCLQILSALGAPQNAVAQVSDNCEVGIGCSSVVLYYNGISFFPRYCVNPSTTSDASYMYTWSDSSNYWGYRRACACNN
jgi:hypothetical protein